MLTDRYAGLKKGPDGLPAPVKLALKTSKRGATMRTSISPWLAWNYVESWHNSSRRCMRFGGYLGT